MQDEVSLLRFQILCLFFLTPACHAEAQQSVGGTPETLRYGAWDAVTVHHSPVTVFYHSGSISPENHCAALNWVIGVGFPEVETFTVKWVVD